MKFTLLHLFIFLFLIISTTFVEGKKRGIHIRKIKSPKHKIKHPRSHHHHVHHAGIHHNRPHHSKHKAHKLVQPTIPLPLYSPPFVGVDNGQIPTVEQVSMILDWLKKVTSTIDVFLRLQATYPDGSDEQRQMIKNVYPPLKVLLAANYAHEYKTGQLSD